MSRPAALRGDGQPIEPGDGVVPILQEVGLKRLKVVGTGFYITRYGLVATAKHVIEELKAPGELRLLPGFVLRGARRIKAYWPSATASVSAQMMQCDGVPQLQCHLRSARRCSGSS